MHRPGQEAFCLLVFLSVTQGLAISVRGQNKQVLALSRPLSRHCPVQGCWGGLRARALQLPGAAASILLAS